jgi:hypothetical protein
LLVDAMQAIRQALSGGLEARDWGLGAGEEQETAGGEG